MPPSLEFIYEQRLKLEILILLAMVEAAEKGNPGFCQFEGGEIDCRNEPSTFCANEECGIELCSQHARSFGASPYCPHCYRAVQGAMLPIIHGARA